MLYRLQRRAPASKRCATSLACPCAAWLPLAITDLTLGLGEVVFDYLKDN
jgi:hypothetical protein